MDAAQCTFGVIPYNGSANQIVAVQGGHVDFMVVNFNDVNRDLEKYKILVITGETCHPMMSDVSVLMEQGYDVTNGITRMFGMPAGVDADILEQLKQGLPMIQII